MLPFERYHLGHCMYHGMRLDVYVQLVTCLIMLHLRESPLILGMSHLFHNMLLRVETWLLTSYTKSRGILSGLWPMVDLMKRSLHTAFMQGKVIRRDSRYFLFVSYFALLRVPLQLNVVGSDGPVKLIEVHAWASLDVQGYQRKRKINIFGSYASEADDR